MSRCIIGRTARIALRKKGQEARIVTLVFPSRWRRSDLLGYVRREHPTETVRIVGWGSVTDGSTWEPSLWIVNPDGFSDYKQARVAA